MVSFCGKGEGFEIVVEILDYELWVLFFDSFEEEESFFCVFATEGEVEGGVHLGGFVFSLTRSLGPAFRFSNFEFHTFYGL